VIAASGGHEIKAVHELLLGDVRGAANPIPTDPPEGE
jgi:hypothetical protein